MSSLGMAPSPRGRSRVPRQRTIALGFEDVTADPRSLARLDVHLDQVSATGVGVSVGRVDWTAFPWPNHPDSWSAPVLATRKDYVAEAIAAIGTDVAGAPREVIAVVDVLVEGWIVRDPAIAGISASGVRSTEFASLTALTSGLIGERIIELVATVAQRYAPSAISLTELFLDTFTFGPDDLGSYRSWCGAADWPRTPAGEIDSAHPRIGQWRAAAVSEFVARVSPAARMHGAELLVEVRASWNGPHIDPGHDGQDYSALLEAAAGLVIWGYFGLHNRSPATLERVARALPDRFGPRFAMSVGLWAEGGAVSPIELAAAVRAAERGGMHSVWIVPASLMTEAHWMALAAEWGP